MVGEPFDYSLRVYGSEIYTNFEKFRKYQIGEILSVQMFLLNGFLSIISLIAPAVLAYHSPRTCIKSQHETILADLNRYMTTTRLVIILTDDAIKHTCI